MQHLSIMKLLNTILLATFSAVLATVSCARSGPFAAERGAETLPAQQASPINVPPNVRTLIEAARARTTIGETYDPSYFAIPYPGGDVPNDRGVCTDVVIRAYRKIDIDLQVLVHEDMRNNFSAYPKIWGLHSTDKNIDHRRVPNLQRFLERMNASLPVSSLPGDYLPGDLVTWRLPNSVPHIGIVSNRKAPGSDRPLILHNIGAGTSEDDILFTYPITGHYRYYPNGA